VVTASDDNTARIWDVETGAEIAILRHTSSVRSAMFSSDGKRIVTASLEVRVWNSESASEIIVMKAPRAIASYAEFSPDGRQVAAAYSDHTARIWDWENGAEIAVLDGHTGGVWGVMFSGDGKRLLTASDDKTARVWDAESSTEIAILKGHTGAVKSAAFDHDGRRAVTASSDRTVIIWDVAWATLIRGDELRERVCAEKLIAAAQEFTATELTDPILRGIDEEDPIARNPCLRRGPLSLDYWTRLPGQWWRTAKSAWTPIH
jgi:WD40 repeat protein